MLTGQGANVGSHAAWTAADLSDPARTAAFATGDVTGSA
jgi:hypothetical protein